MKNKFSLLILIFLFVGFYQTLSAEGAEDYDAFLVAKKAYEDGFYGASLDLLNRFIINYPQSKYYYEVKLYTALCHYQKEDFIKARNILSELEKYTLPVGVRDRLLFWLGQIYFRGKDFKHSIEYFEKLVKDYPDSYLIPNAKIQLGWSLFLDSRFKDAAFIFDSLVDSEELAVQEEALFEKGEALYQLKDYESVVKNFMIFVDVFPESKRLAKAFFYIGESNFYLNKFVEAVKFYEKAIEAGDDESLKNMARQGLGWAYLEQKELDKSKDAFSEIDASNNLNSNTSGFLFGQAILHFRLDMFEESLAYYDQLINSYPDSDVMVQAYFGKAECLDNLERYDGAIESYRKVLEINSKQTKDEDIREIVDRASYNLAWAYLKKGDFKSAIEEFRNVVSLSEDKTVKLSALCQIGDVYQDAKEYDKAIQIYDQILKDNPDSPYSDYVQFQLGYVLLKTEQIDSAILAFRSLNKNFSSSSLLDDANFYLGYGYFQKGDFHNSMNQLQTFLKAFPNSVYKDRASYLLGVSYYNLEKYKEAIGVFERIIKQFSHDADLVEKAEYDIADSLFQMGYEKKAIKRFNRFIDKYKDSGMSQDIIFWLGQHYYRKDKFNESRKYFERIVRMFPEHDLAKKAQYEIGMTFFEEKNYNRAIRYFKELISQDSDTDIKVKAILAMGDLFLEQNKEDEAIEMYEDLMQNKSDLSKIGFLRLADLYKNKREYGKAIEFYEKAKKTMEKESYAAIQFEIAECFEEQHDFDAAVEAYLGIPYLHDSDTVWVIKGLLRSARIYEDKENWEEAIKIYQKVTTYSVAEAKFAQEKVNFLKQFK